MSDGLDLTAPLRLISQCQQLAAECVDMGQLAQQLASLVPNPQRRPQGNELLRQLLQSLVPNVPWKVGGFWLKVGCSWLAVGWLLVECGLKVGGCWLKAG